ncbi:MAG: FtsX-like permease family protein [Acidobacteriota bacterium]|nr:FtsX-like permease family protein [Acidobacteriota bacterium]
MNALRRGARNAFRNAMRSVGVVVILGVAIALSISMLIARGAVDAKISAVRSSTGNTITVSPAGFFAGQGGGTPLTTAQVTGLLSVPNVTAVQASLSERLSSTQTNLTSPTLAGSLGQRFGGFAGGASGSAGNLSVPIRVTGTNSPGTSLVGGANGGGTEKLTAGVAFSATSHADVAIVGADLATKNDLKVGSTFRAWGATITVVGIYDAGSTFANAGVLMPLATVQRLASAANQVTGATVTVNSLGNVSGAVSAITKKLGTAADVTSTQATVQSQLAPLNSVKTISTYTLIGAVVGAAVILLLSMLMIVRERRREIGVLKALGATNRSVASQFVAESTTFTVLGALVGGLVGVLISSPLTSALVSASGGASPTGFVRSGGGFTGAGTGFTPPAGAGGALGFRGFRGISNTLSQLHTSASWSTLAFALLAALVIAAFGSTVASATVTRVRPAEVLRSE